jgi:hypothetical protein
MMNAPGATENACTRGVVYTLVDFTLTVERTATVFSIGTMPEFCAPAFFITHRKRSTHYAQNKNARRAYA